jgi:hypothetical protein
MGSVARRNGHISWHESGKYMVRIQARLPSRVYRSIRMQRESTWSRPYRLPSHNTLPVPLSGPAPRSWTLSENPPVAQPLNNFPTFSNETRTFITVFTRAHHCSLSSARWIKVHTTPSHLLVISILILNSHRRLGLPSGLFPFPTVIPFQASSCGLR